MRRATWDLTRPGWAILTAILILVTIGVASIYVTDTHYATGHDGPRNAAKQCIRVVVGFIVAACALRASPAQRRAAPVSPCAAVCTRRFASGRGCVIL